MKEKELSKLTDQEVLKMPKKIKSSSVINALCIGFLIGIVIFSVANNSLGFLTFIPLYIAYLLIKNSKRNRVIKQEMKARNLP